MSEDISRTYEQRIEYVAVLASYRVESSGYSYRADGTVDEEVMQARILKKAAELWVMDDAQLAWIEEAVYADMLRKSPLRNITPAKRFHIPVTNT